LGCYCNYCFGKWSTCSKGGLPPFLSPHPMTNRYPYCQKQLLNLDGHHHCWFNSHIYGATNTNNDNKCNNDGYSGKDTMKHWRNTKQWLHSPCYWNIWMSSFLFWFIFYHLCLDHYHTSSTVFFSPLNAWFLISTTHVHSLAMCLSHSNFSMSCCTWSRFHTS